MTKPVAPPPRQLSLAEGKLRVAREMSATARAAIEDVADRHRLSLDELAGRSRTQRAVRARQEAMYVARMSGASYPQIGRLLDRDHTTVMFGVRAHAARVGRLSATA